jgi:hypothetical protein
MHVIRVVIVGYQAIAIVVCLNCGGGFLIPVNLVKIDKEVSA